MNRFIDPLIRAGVAALLVAACPAQDSVPTNGDADFDGVVKLRTPDAARWTVRYRPSALLRVNEERGTRRFDLGEMPPDLPANQLVEQIRSLEVTKFHGTYRELHRYSNGDKREKWIKGTLQFAEQADGRTLMMASVNLLDPEFSDYSQEDFEELGWLRKEHFRGVAMHGNKRCLLFEVDSASKPQTRRDLARRAAMEELKRFEGNAPETETAGQVGQLRLRVLLDAATRLPVLFDDGVTIRTYHFDAPPTAQPEMPAKFKREFEAWQKVLNEARRKPVAP